MSSNKQNTRKISNVFAPEKRKTLFTVSAITVALMAWGIYLSVDSNKEPEIIQLNSQIKNNPINVQEDKLGQTQLTNETRVLEYELDKQKVEEQVSSGNSAIMERKNELNPIAYKPKNKLEVIETPKVEEPEIEVKKVQETTAINPVAIQNTEIPVVESYRAPSYAKANRQAIEALKQQMATSEVLKVDQSKPDGKFEPVLFSYFSDYSSEQKQKKELDAKIKEMKITAEYAPVTHNPNGYNPSERVVNDQTAGFNQGIKNVLFRAGERVSAITLLKASSQQLGPILATIAEGEYAGAELMGTVTRGVDKLNFSFNTMWLPKEQIRIPVDAIALQFEDQTVGTATDVDNRSFRRFILKPILKGIGAAGQYYAQDEGTTIANNNGVIVESKSKRTADVARKVALGSIADNMANAIDDLDTSQIVTQDQHTPIVIMFMSDVVPTDEIKENALKNNAVQVIDEPKSSDVKSTTSKEKGLTKEEALSLQESGGSQDPKVQAEIIKALAQ